MSQLQRDCPCHTSPSSRTPLREGFVLSRREYIAPQSASDFGLGCIGKTQQSEEPSARLLKMDADGEKIQITRAGPTDIDEISLLIAKASEHNPATRTNLTNFDPAARETFARFLYARALDDSTSSNVVFKATDSQGVVVACVWLQWFHGHLRSWIDSQPGCTLPHLKPLALTIPACIRKENYYKNLVVQHQHRMAWMESKSCMQGNGHWCKSTTSSKVARLLLINVHHQS